MAKQISLHLSDKLHAEIKEAAKTVGLSISGFLRWSAASKAKKCLNTGKQ